MKLLGIFLVMGVIKVSSLGSSMPITIKYWDDSFVLRLDVRNDVAEGQGRNQSLTGCWRTLIPRRNTCQNTVVGHLVVGDFFPTTYVHIEGKYQCDWIF